MSLGVSGPATEPQWGAAQQVPQQNRVRCSLLKLYLWLRNVTQGTRGGGGRFAASAGVNECQIFATPSLVP